MDLDAVDAGVDTAEVVERNPDDADWSLELEPMEGVDSGDELECVNTLKATASIHHGKMLAVIG
jgi:hypothetical protein